MHVQEDHFLIEIIDPKTGEHVKDGEQGEVVFTTDVYKRQGYERRSVEQLCGRYRFCFVQHDFSVYVRHGRRCGIHAPDACAGSARQPDHAAPGSPAYGGMLCLL